MNSNDWFAIVLAAFSGVGLYLLRRLRKRTSQKRNPEVGKNVYQIGNKVSGKMAARDIIEIQNNLDSDHDKKSKTTRR